MGEKRDAGTRLRWARTRCGWHSYEMSVKFMARVSLSWSPYSEEEENKKKKKTTRLCNRVIEDDGVTHIILLVATARSKIQCSSAISTLVVLRDLYFDFTVTQEDTRHITKRGGVAALKYGTQVHHRADEITTAATNSE